MRRARSRRRSIAELGLAICCALGSSLACSESASNDAGALQDARDSFPDAEPAESGAPDAFADAAPDAAEPLDADPPDLGAPDGGVIFMPCAEPGGACATHADCAAPEEAPGNCDSCPDYHRSLCFDRACSTPAPLEGGDVHELSFSVDANVPVIASLVWMAVARDTPSGMELDREGVLSGGVDFANACYGVLDVRYREILQPGDTYSIVLGSFASGLPTMFVVLGYGDTRGRGPILGVSCTEYQVGAPGTGVVRFQGEPMHRRE